LWGEEVKAVIQKVPVPLSGVMLGCAALGNLLQSYSEGARLLFGGISLLLLLVLLLKLAIFPAVVGADLKNPIIMGVSATFPMGLMLLSVYAKPFLGPAAAAIWFAAIGLHLVLICAFTYRFFKKLDITKVFASYFVVYVGIATAGVSAPAFGMTSLGTAAFWFGFVCLLGLLVLMGYRYIKYPAIPEPAQPVFCIFAAPASLCLAAYLQSVDEKRLEIVLVLAVLATALYLLSLGKLFTLLRRPFYPSHASFTFPFVISAIAMKQLGGYLGKVGVAAPFLPAVVMIETVIATVLVCLTLARFIVFVLRAAAEAKQAPVV
jgi:exfoliative toxin A/B